VSRKDGFSNKKKPISRTLFPTCVEGEMRPGGDLGHDPLAHLVAMEGHPLPSFFKLWDNSNVLVLLDFYLGFVFAFLRFFHFSFIFCNFFFSFFSFMFLFTENLNILKYEYFILEHFKNKNNFYIQTIFFLKTFQI
jgi:hypothetical protein